MSKLARNTKYYLVIWEMNPLPSLGRIYATAHFRPNHVCLYSTSAWWMFSSTFLQVAWVYWINQRPVLAKWWPLFPFQIEIEGDVYPWGVSESLVAPSIPAFPMRGSWTLRCTKNWTHCEFLRLMIGSLVGAVIGKYCLHPLFAQGFVWVERVFWVWRRLKRYYNNRPLSRSYYVLGWEWELVLQGRWLDASQRCFGFVSHRLL